MRYGNVKMALAALRSSKWRSLLTMLGIIIGVVSVVTTVSLGEGVKRQVSGQINHMGKDLLIVRSGKQSSQNSGLSAATLFGGMGSSALNGQDVKVAQQAQHVKFVVPIALAGGLAEVEGRDLPGGTIIATTENLPGVFKQKVVFGEFFSGPESDRHVAVIGKTVAEQLFQENVPVGRSLTIRGQQFIVRGVFEEFEANPLAPGTDLNKAVFIPYSVAKTIAGGTLPITSLISKVDQPINVPVALQSTRQKLRSAHAGQEDFTVLTQDESLAATGKIVNLITQMITGIAAISLIVGGIGIMNIMFVSVSERTREIGIRKALGATNRQILGQFLVEAAVLSFVGGVIGVLLSILANFGIRIFTNLHPVVTIPVIVIAAGVSWLVGVIFGVTPAIRAAHKDPIDALRYE